MPDELKKAIEIVCKYCSYGRCEGCEITIIEDEFNEEGNE